MRFLRQGPVIALALLGLVSIVSRVAEALSMKRGRLSSGSR
jgi:hypothetical protein